jgi:hypothetical protein
MFVADPRRHPHADRRLRLQGRPSRSPCVGGASALLDRGWGKAPQQHTGEEGGAIQVTID